MTKTSTDDAAAEQVQLQALQLRTQALGLLQQAGALDGLKLFAVTHRHRFGSSTYLLWAAQSPQEH